MSSQAVPGLCRFIFTADLHVLVRCRVDRLLPQAQAEELIGDEPLDIEVDLVLDGEVFWTARSSQAVFDASPEKGFFRPQHFMFALTVRDLPRLCSFVIRLRPQGSTSCVYRGVLPLFSRRAVLRQGKQLVALERVDGAGGTNFDWTEHSNDAQIRAGPPELEEALRLAQAADLHARGWLPAAAPGFEGSEEAFARSALETLEESGVPWLSVHLPMFTHPVVFAEPQYGQEIEVPTGILAAPRREDADSKSLAALGGAGWLLQPLTPAGEQAGAGVRCFKCFVDSDASNEHPAVLKDMRLARSARNRVKDRDARPNADELRRLNELIRRPKRQFSAEEKHLLFRFRWSLTDQPGALTKFLHAVDWSDLEERQHAIELLGRWSPVDIDDALELLSKDFRGVSEVRRHAVARLRSARDEDLQLYLLQLVQALRYEPILEEGTGGGDAAVGQEEESPASAPPVSLNPTSEHSPANGASASTPANAGGEGPGQGRATEGLQRCALMWFLIRRAVRCRTLATLFYWYVVAETDDREKGAVFHRVRDRFMEALGESAEGLATRQMLERQVALRRKLLWCVQCAKVMKRDRIEKKVERFRQALALEPPPPEDGRPPCRLALVEGLEEAVPLPVDPRVSLARVMAEQSFLLKSAMNPAVLTCQVQRTSEGPRGKKTQKKIMVKEGDDLRQDQLVLQLIILMDAILKKYGLDMQLTTYQVIALSTNDGMIEFVPDASNLSSVLKDHNNDIQQFFRAHHPLPTEAGAGGEAPGTYGPGNSYGIRPEVLENFIRSSAGYCVITYILGIGDRHLDNLMVTPDGRLFHIDFGFILGKDPKPFPPPMRICKEMVEGMGGNSSPGYQSFKSKCCQAYKILRRHSKLIINLLYLMTDSGIKDLCGDPQFAILKVEQKFQALMDDEQAEEHFLKLIDESVNALFPVMMEKLHKLSIAMQ